MNTVCVIMNAVECHANDIVTTACTLVVFRGVKKTDSMTFACLVSLTPILVLLSNRNPFFRASKQCRRVRENHAL